MFKRVISLRDVANLRMPLSGRGYCYVTASSRRVKIFYVLKKDRIFLRKSRLTCCKKHRNALKNNKYRLYRRRSLKNAWVKTIGSHNYMESGDQVHSSGRNSNNKRIDHKDRNKKEDTFKLKTLKRLRSIENHLIAQNKLLANLAENMALPIKSFSGEPLNEVPYGCDCVKVSFWRRLFCCFS